MKRGFYTRKAEMNLDQTVGDLPERPILLEITTQVDTVFLGSAAMIIAATSLPMISSDARPNDPARVTQALAGTSSSLD